LESFHKAKSSYAIFAAGAVVGLACGFGLGFLVLKGADKNAAKEQGQPSILASSDQQAGQTKALKIATDPAIWTDFPVEWKRLKPFSEAGKAPITISTPTAQYDYGAVSHAIPADLVGKALILRVDVADVKHNVGVSLVDPQGSPLRSEEQGLSDKDKNSPVAQKVYRRWNEQDTQLQQQLMPLGWYRWGATWVQTSPESRSSAKRICAFGDSTGTTAICANTCSSWSLSAREGLSTATISRVPSSISGTAR